MLAFPRELICLTKPLQINQILTLNNPQGVEKENSCGVLVNELDNDIVVSEFEFQSHYYFHFGIYTLEKGMSSLSPPQL